MIVGTAGHIDHGKTTLVRALTGVDTDRLPEEKQRGISIELGYAFLDVPGSDARIGFVDVPGHERLVHTMLAGATGIDLALLLVAADDGVMPQTREHLAVLCLLGLARAIVVLTKVDRVDAARREAVRCDVAALLADTALAASPVLAVAAPSSEGLAELRELLFAAAREQRRRDEGDAGFRLAVDRAFTLAGVGTVATGSVHAGRVAVGDELRLMPAAAAEPIRVRSLHAQNSVAADAAAGQRCAIGLAGTPKESVARGRWLCAPAVALETERIDVRLELWHEEARALRSGTVVHAHIGAAGVMASIALLHADRLEPGASALAQLVLRAPIAAWHGDRIVLRDAGATRTVAGGVVLDPYAPARYRRTPQRLAALTAWQSPDAASRLAALLDAAPNGVDLTAWGRAEGRLGDPAAVVPAGTVLGAVDPRRWGLAPQHADAVRGDLLARLAAFHAERPDELGPDSARLRRWTAPRLVEPLWRAVVERALAGGRLAQRGAQLHLPEHGAALSALEERIAQKVMPLLDGAGFEPHWVRDLAAETREGEALLRTVLARLAQRGEVHQIVRDLYHAAGTVARLAALARQIAARDGDVRAAAFRDATGLGRKRAIQLLEFFDRVGLLRRVGEAHRLRSDSALFSDSAG